MQGEARGTFEVNLLPIGGNDGPIAVMSIDKTSMATCRAAVSARCWPSARRCRARPATWRWNG
jgi:hypothetical protein